LVVLRHAVGAAKRSRLDLSGIGGHGRMKRVSRSSF
jgi:hypothetical protein